MSMFAVLLSYMLLSYRCRTACAPHPDLPYYP
jgi:hypothetical protein